MLKKIALVAPMAADPTNDKHRQSLGSVFGKNGRRFEKDGIEVDYYFLNKGITGIDDLPYDALLGSNMFELFEGVKNLSDKGYDAVVLNCFSCAWRNVSAMTVKRNEIDTQHRGNLAKFPSLSN